VYTAQTGSPSYDALQRLANWGHSPRGATEPTDATRRTR